MRSTNIGVSLIIVSLAFGLPSCGGDGDGAQGQSLVGIFGTVSDVFGNAVSGARIDIGGVSTTTDDNGQFVLESPTGNMVASFGGDGYLPTVRNLTISPSSPTAAHIVLRDRAPSIPINTDTGGMAMGDRGATVMVEPGTLMDPNGASVSGMVDVFLTPADPSDDDEVQTFAGGFEGRSSESSSDTMLLESFGMVDVTIMQGDDELQIMPGETLEIRVPAPANLSPSELPATMPLWSFDEETGQWIEEGTSTYEPSTNTYVGRINHMSPWNCDQEAEATCVTGLAVDANGDPIAGAEVDAKGLDYNGSSSASTQEDGRFYLAVRKDSSVSVAVSHEFGGGQIQNVMSGSQDTSVPPTPGDSRCLDIGTFVIQRGVVVLDDGTVVLCDNTQVESIFGGTCAEGLGDIFVCWNPQGECMFDFGGTFAIIYENGARLQSDATGQSFQFLAPGGMLCGTGTVDVNLATSEATTTFSNTTGQSWVFLANDASSDQMIMCPNGEIVTISTQEQQAVNACTGGDMSDVGEMCTGGDITPPDSCSNDNDCPNLAGLNWVCCDIGVAGVPPTCLPAESCSAL